MKTTLSLLLTAAVTTSAMAAPSLDLTVRRDDGSSSIVVAPGETINFEVFGVLSSDTDNEGLALFGLDLTNDGGPLDGSVVINPTTDPVMANFTRNAGITNPDSPCPPACGFSGTIISGDLVQVGGGQNTINNTAANAPFPIGGVIVNVAHPPAGQILAEGSITAPAGVGVYTLSIPVSSVFANVISPGQGCAPIPADPSTFCAAEAATVGAVVNLQYEVADSCAPATATVWESVGFHGGGFAADWAMAITPRNGSNEPTFSEPRFSGLSRVVVSFAGGTVDAASAVPGNILVAGVDAGGSPVDLSGVTIGVALQSGDTQMEISFSPALPRDAVYTVALDGVTTCNGTAVAGDTERCMSAVLGDVNGDKRVAANDVGGTSSFVGIDPIDPVTQPFHARADVNNDGRVRANDVGGISGLVGTDLRGVACPAP